MVETLASWRCLAKQAREQEAKISEVVEGLGLSCTFCMLPTAFRVEHGNRLEQDRQEVARRPHRPVHPLQLAQQEARAVDGIELEVEGRIEGERR